MNMIRLSQTACGQAADWCVIDDEAWLESLMQMSELKQGCITTDALWPPAQRWVGPWPVKAQAPFWRLVRWGLHGSDMFVQNHIASTGLPSSHSASLPMCINEPWPPMTLSQVKSLCLPIFPASTTWGQNVHLLSNISHQLTGAMTDNQFYSLHPSVVI